MPLNFDLVSLQPLPKSKKAKQTFPAIVYRQFEMIVTQAKPKIAYGPQKAVVAGVMNNGNFLPVIFEKYAVFNFEIFIFTAKHEIIFFVQQFNFVLIQN